MATLTHLSPVPPNHFLALARPDVNGSLPEGVPDTSTLAAHDFDVDNRTGFMPPQPPIGRLPHEWEAWEVMLEDAVQQRLQLGDKVGLLDEDARRSEAWRARVLEMPILGTEDLRMSEINLRRAHHVLSWTMHFYIHTLPPTVPEIHIPPPITLPLLQVCAQLQLPPVLTYSDDVLYNWRLKVPSTEPCPALDNLECQTLFTGTVDEAEFYLTCARMELRGVEALELMRATMDEAFVGDDIAIRRITAFLQRLEVVIRDLHKIFLSVRDHVDPEVFYSEIRPWFRGLDSDPQHRPWIFDGIEQDPTLAVPTELSGPSAGQSSTIHALDVFLGVDKYSHAPSLTGSSAPAPPPGSGPVKQSFLSRMQKYMPRHHRAFLTHLASNPRPLRAIVAGAGDAALKDAYNASVKALKEYRDAHMIIVALYIIGPARRHARGAGADHGAGEGSEEVDASLRGTGGTELVQFLKKVRDRTAGAVLPV